MKRLLSISLAVISVALPSSAALQTPKAGGRGGTITGKIHLAGPAPANPIIRMGADPLCNKMNRGGQRPVQQLVVTGADGGLANVLVDLQGSFPASPAPTEPVVIDQRGCIYTPRVAGARIGQTLRVVNSDMLLHEVHSISVKGNEFDTTQPKSGMVFNYQLKNEESPLRLGCRVHSWMTSYVAVLTHPYFAVSTDAGTFTIANVPAGKYTIRTWHERFGRLTKTVAVTPGETATINFEYTGNEKPAVAGVRDLLMPRTTGDQETRRFLTGG
jgi:hypothetical protein